MNRAELEDATEIATGPPEEETGEFPTNPCWPDKRVVDDVAGQADDDLDHLRQRIREAVESVEPVDPVDPAVTK